MLLDIGVFSAGVVESRIVAASRGHSSGMVMIRNILSTDGPAGAGGSGRGSGTPHAASSALTCLVKSRLSGFSGGMVGSRERHHRGIPTTAGLRTEPHR